MKRIVIYILLLGAAVMLPLHGTDVGKLHPVELVQINKEAETVVINTDTGEEGRGTTLREAVENLKATTSGIVFLDTAEYLLYAKSAQGELELIKQYLKPNVMVCESVGEIDLKEAAAFLAVHKPTTKLKTVNAVQKVQILRLENDKMILKEN